MYLLHDPDTAEQPIPYALLIAIYTVAVHGSRRTRAWARSPRGGRRRPARRADPAHAERGHHRAGAGAVRRGLGHGPGRGQPAGVRPPARTREGEEAHRAVERERAAIARDMHDVLGHAISLIVVQAEAGPLTVRPDPVRAEAAFDAIATTGRDAMDQLRRLLGLLGQSSPETPPTVARIGTLCESVDRAGQRTTLTVNGTPRPLPPDVEAAAYRVIQEALTNAVKHARAATVAVELDWRKDALVIGVTDDGRGHTGGSGHGLVGIRERAAACGGSASFGPGPDRRGFAVSVRLPGAAA
ncbi:sensor histidine kinase [Streptosporangium lutulentum]